MKYPLFLNRGGSVVWVVSVPLRGRGHEIEDLKSRLARYWTVSVPLRGRGHEIKYALRFVF